jgi:hypothetical protein
MSDTAAENFPEAGLFIRNTSEYYQIISYHKGGAFYHYDKKVRHTTLSGGIVATDARGRYYSSQSYDTSGRIEVHNGTVSVISGLTEIHNEVPMPWQFVCVRLASITLLRLKLFNQIIKKALVYYLITRKKKCNIYARRDITCGPQLAIRDSLLSEESGVSICEKSTAFSAIHMASQGYWQIGDDSGTQEYR